MSRSGYSEDTDTWDLVRWRGAVASAIRGKRGQAFLGEMLAALDALPEKRLIENDLENAAGVCALGAVGRARGIDMTKIDPYDHDTVAAKFGLPHALACEVAFVNDDGGWRHDTPEARYARVREWVVGQLKKEPAEAGKEPKP